MNTISIWKRKKEWKVKGDTLEKNAKDRIKGHNNCFFLYSSDSSLWISPWRQTANSDYYVEVFKRLRGRMGRVQPNLRCKETWILHAPTRSSVTVGEFLARNLITILLHHTSITTCDLFVFLKCENSAMLLKSPLLHRTWKVILNNGIGDGKSAL